MAVTTLPVSAAYIGDAVTTDFPTTFAFLADEQVEVYIDDVLQVAGYAVTGAGDAAGGTVVFDAAPSLSAIVAFRRVTPLTQEIQPVNNATVFAETLETGLDLGVMRDQETEAQLDAKLDAPPAEQGAGYVAIDADGNAVIASGTGADAALRADLGEETGATLVGSSFGQSVELRLAYLDQQYYDYAFANPPFAAPGFTFAGALPTPATHCCFASLDAAGGYIMIRELRSWGGIDEYIYRYVTGVNFDGGWMLYSWRCFALGRVWPILRQPLDDGQATANEIAFRLGIIGTDVYPTDYHFSDLNGIGPHGNMTKTGTKSFLMNGGGTNREPAANRPTGLILFGTAFTMTENYDMKYRGVTASPGTTVCTLNVLRSFDRAFGSVEVFTFVPTVINLGFQDSPAPMMATNFGGPFNRAKIDGNPLIVTLTGPDVEVQRGNWRVSQPKSGIARLFPADFPYIAPTVQALRGPLVGKGAPNYTDLAPYAGNRFGVWHITDNSQFAKFTGYMVSAEEALPRNAEPMGAIGTSWQAYTARGTQYFPNGLPA